MYTTVVIIDRILRQSAAFCQQQIIHENTHEHFLIVWLVMRNLLWNSLRSASAMFACSVLQCSSKHGSGDSDNTVRSRHMGQVIALQHRTDFFDYFEFMLAVASVVTRLE
jgi:hypothetical protein